MASPADEGGGLVQGEEDVPEGEAAGPVHPTGGPVLVGVGPVFCEDLPAEEPVVPSVPGHVIACFPNNTCNPSNYPRQVVQVASC